MKVKISEYNYYGKASGKELNWSKVIEDTREERLNFLLESRYVDTEDELRECDFNNDLDKFLNGEINYIDYNVEGDWDDPTACGFAISTYEDEIKKLEEQIEKLKRAFGIE